MSTQIAGPDGKFTKFIPSGPQKRIRRKKTKEEADALQKKKDARRAIVQAAYKAGKPIPPKAQPKTPKPRAKAGSEEALEIGRKLTEKRKEKRDAKTKADGDDVSVTLPLFGESRLLVPSWFVAKNTKGKWQLVSPTSKERNLSTRKEIKSIIMVQKRGLGHSVVVNKKVTIPLMDFTKADRGKIREHIKEVKSQAGKAPALMPTLDKKAGKERGRPLVVGSNIDEHYPMHERDKEDAETLLKSDYGKKSKQAEEDRRKSKETPPESDDEPTENVVIKTSKPAKKKVGRPVKWESTSLKKEKKGIGTQKSNWKKKAERDAKDATKRNETNKDLPEDERKTAKGQSYPEDETPEFWWNKAEANRNRLAANKAAKGKGFSLFGPKSRNRAKKIFKSVVSKPVGKIIKNVQTTIKKAPATIENVFEGAVDVAEEIGSRGKQVVKKILYQDHNFPLDMKHLLDQFGHQTITKAVLKRSPVSGVITGALDVFSLGKFGKRMKPFDELFHLWIEFRLAKGGEMRLEKNARITLSKAASTDKEGTESLGIEEAELPSDLNLDLILDRTRNYMGDSKFFQYNASNNNCQVFIAAVLKSNKIGTAQDITWVKQETENLFKNQPGLRKIANTATELGARLESLGDAFRGGSINKVCDDCAEKYQTHTMPDGTEMEGATHIEGSGICSGCVGKHICEGCAGKHLCADCMTGSGFSKGWNDWMESKQVIGDAPLQSQNQREIPSTKRSIGLGLKDTSPDHNEVLPTQGKGFSGLNDKGGESFSGAGLFTMSEAKARQLLSQQYLSLGGNMSGRGLDEDNIDFDDIRWGSFTAMFKRFEKQNPHNKKIKDLKDFAKMILDGKGKFSKKAHKKANFYINVILRKK
tara:strand:+ start:6228 stop:8840 length:2613 start_codon:yes stop_codon:yes gene_type:complete